MLERQSRRTGKSIAELIRDAIDQTYATDTDMEQRRAALEHILAAEPMPVEDWDAMKRDLRDSLYGRMP